MIGMDKKTIFILLAIQLMLGGCFGDNSTPATQKIEGYHYYEGPDFGMQIPDEWEAITPDKFQSSMPGNTVIAFRSDIKNTNFTANVVVLKNGVPSETKSMDYAKALRDKMASTLLGYNEISAENIKIIAGGMSVESLLLKADGKDGAAEDLKRYMQISGVAGEKAIVVLGAFLPVNAEGIEKKIETMTRSLTVK